MTASARQNDMPGGAISTPSPPDCEMPVCRDFGRQTGISKNYSRIRLRCLLRPPEQAGVLSLLHKFRLEHHLHVINPAVNGVVAVCEPDVAGLGPFLQGAG